MAKIKDPDIANALQTLYDEIENYECTMEELEEALQVEEKKVESLNEEVANLEARIKELEEALMEAHLTGVASE